jgi:hypothetical protein
MRYIEPHAHMVSRTTDDYTAMALAGCAAVCEPAFWAGFDRGSAQGFYDYFRQLTEHEPKRAARYGLPHYCWLCINPKEAEDLTLAREVLALIPEFLAQPNVLGIGEIGLNKNTRNELRILEEHIELAMKHGQLILIHTPHLEDKWKGTRLIIDVLRQAKVDPARVIVDHVEEHTVDLVIEAGFWAGITLYPESKCTPARAIDIYETSPGAERLWLNSACDWGHSDPLAVPKAALEMRRRGFAEATIEKLIFENPCRFLRQSPNFRVE